MKKILFFILFLNISLLNAQQQSEEKALISKVDTLFKIKEDYSSLSTDSKYKYNPFLNRGIINYTIDEKQLGRYFIVSVIKNPDFFTGDKKNTTYKTSFKYTKQKDYRLIKNQIIDLYQGSPDFQIDLVSVKVISGTPLKKLPWGEIVFFDSKKEILFRSTSIIEVIEKENKDYINSCVKSSSELLNIVTDNLKKDIQDFNHEETIQKYNQAIKDVSQICIGASRDYDKKISDIEGILEKHKAKLGKIGESICQKILDKGRYLSSDLGENKKAQDLYDKIIHEHLLELLTPSARNQIEDIIRQRNSELGRIDAAPWPITREPIKSILEKRIEEDLNSNKLRLTSSHTAEYIIRLDKDGNNQSKCKGCPFDSKIGEPLTELDGSIFKDPIPNTQFFQEYEGSMEFEIKRDYSNAYGGERGGLWGVEVTGTKDVLTIKGANMEYSSDYNRYTDCEGYGSVYTLWGIIPGAGLAKVSDGDCWYYDGWDSEYHNWRTWIVYSTYGLGVLFNSISNTQYDKYQSSTNQPDMDKHLNTANATGTIANYAFGIGITLHLTEIVEVFVNGLKNDKAKREFRPYEDGEFKSITFE